MKSLLVSVGVALSLATGVTFANPANVTPVSQNVSWQTAVWQHIPLNITLPVGKERIIRVPHSAKIGLPASIVNNIVSQRFDGWFYLTATSSFPSTPVEIQDNQTGQTILINLSAQKGAPDTAVNIVYPKEKPSHGDTSAESGQQASALSGSMAYKTLTQYAEQQLYAPKRLLKNPYGIQLVQSYPNSQGNVPQSKWVYNLFVDGSVVGIPWAQWQGGGRYVTAVVINNLLPVRLDLVHNIVNLCGRNEGVWKSVVFFPYQKGHIWQLAPQGNVHDSTVAFLVSDVPFNEALRQCGGQ